MRVIGHGGREWRIEPSDEGIALVFGDGKYEQDPPRPAMALEIALHEQLRGAVDLIRELAECAGKGVEAESVDGQAWNDRAWVIARCRDFLGGQ